jgi:predicted secreted protein
MARMRGAVAAVLWMLLSAAARAQTVDAVSASATWVPSPAELEAIRLDCATSPAGVFETCAIDRLERGGVPEGALSFSRRLRDANHHALGFLSAFRKTGRVSVAHVTYPFDRNRASGYWLVNGNPALIDVDDRGRLPLPDLGRDKTYGALLNRYGDVVLVAGRRDEPGEPEAFATTDGGQRFIVSYDLRKPCAACEVIGAVKFAFDFDADGVFQGAALMSVTDRVPGSRTAPPPHEVSEEPARTLTVRVGESFTITLDAESTPGHGWRLAREFDPAVLTRIEQPDPARPTRGGRAREVWVFKAVAMGVVPLVFEYGRGSAAPAKTLRFTIVVR